MKKQPAFDFDGDDQDDGIVGGEAPDFEDGGPYWDWRPPQEVCDAADLCKGDGYGYLGHFGNAANLRRGHNFVDKY